MFSKDEIRDFYNKGYTTQAYKAIVAEYAELFEKLDFKVIFEQLKQELDLPLNYHTLYMTIWRKKKAKEKEREKKIPGEQQSEIIPEAAAPGREEIGKSIIEDLEKLDKRGPAEKQWDF